MNKLVYQIIIGELPIHLKECVESVKNFSYRNKYEYECVTELPKKYSGRDYRMASDWIRLEKLATRPYTLYVDWDVKIIEDFTLGENIIAACMSDILMYFGPHIDFGKAMLKRAIEKYNYKDVEGLCHFTFKELIGDNHAECLLSSNCYRHTHWNSVSVLYNKQKERRV